MNPSLQESHDDAFDAVRHDEISPLPLLNEYCANCNRRQIRTATGYMQETEMATDSWEIFGL